MSDPTLISVLVTTPWSLYVRSRVAPSAKDVLSEATFLRWYEEHAEEAVAKSGIHSLFRYNTVGRSSASDASKSFLTTPVLDDTGFLLSEEFEGISPTSTILPATGNVYDLVEFDINYLALRKILVSKKGYKGLAKSIVTIEIQSLKDVNADAIDALLSKHVRTLEEEPTYTRSLVFESCFSFASAGGKKPVEGDLWKQHE